jgi:hypothetical protein
MQCGGALVIDFGKGFESNRVPDMWGPPSLNRIQELPKIEPSPIVPTQRPPEQETGPGYSPEAVPGSYLSESDQMLELERMFPNDPVWRKKVSALFVRQVHVPEGTMYQPGSHNGQLNTHNGQMKLLVNEANTIACQLMRYRRNNTTIQTQALLANTVILCLGSASGNARESHFKQLVHLFPGVHWVMYDPHNVEANIFGQYKNMVHVYQKLFGVHDIAWWQEFKVAHPGVNLIVLSDIRSDLFTNELHMRRMTMWRLLASALNANSPQIQALFNSLNFALDEETFVSSKNSMRIRSDNCFQTSLVMKIRPDCASLKYVAEWQGAEEIYRKHGRFDTVITGALMRQFAGPPSSTELRHTVVGNVPTYVKYQSLKFPTPQYSYINPQFGRKGYFHQDYVNLIDHWMPSCTDDIDVTNEDKNVMSVDQEQIEKQCVVMNNTPGEQDLILEVCREVVQKCQREFNINSTSHLQITHAHRHRHNSGPWHAIQTMMGHLLEIYWRFRAETHSEMFWQSKKLLNLIGKTVRPYLERHKSTTWYNETLQPFDELQQMWLHGQSGVGYILTAYTRKLYDAIHDFHGYKNHADQEPVAPLYGIPCTAECLYLLVVTGKRYTASEFKESLETSLTDLHTPHARWFLKHALAQLTSSGYGAVLQQEGTVAEPLRLVLDSLRALMQHETLGISNAYLDNRNTVFVNTDPGCWGPFHKHYCRDPDFLTNRHWQIQFYNVMLPRLLDECRPTENIYQDTLSLDRFRDCLEPYQRSDALLYRLHMWPSRSPVFFYVAQHPSDNNMVLGWMREHITKKFKKKDPYLLQRKRDGCAVLHLAAYHGNVACVRMLSKLRTTEPTLWDSMIKQENRLSETGEIINALQKGETPIMSARNRRTELLKTAPVENEELLSKLASVINLLGRKQTTSNGWQVVNRR